MLIDIDMDSNKQTKGVYYISYNVKWYLLRKTRSRKFQIDISKTSKEGYIKVTIEGSRGNIQGDLNNVLICKPAQKHFGLGKTFYFKIIK